MKEFTLKEVKKLQDLNKEFEIWSWFHATEIFSYFCAVWKEYLLDDFSEAYTLESILQTKMIFKSKGYSTKFFGNLELPIQWLYDKNYQDTILAYDKNEYVKTVMEKMVS
jgi:hypothetical protein